MNKKALLVFFAVIAIIGNNRRFTANLGTKALDLPRLFLEGGTSVSTVCRNFLSASDDSSSAP
jgi:hypothetical protein